MSIIQVENLKYQYPSAEHLALNNLTFTINQGEFIGIAGANKAGKTSLCMALCGLIPHFFKGAYGGNVLVNDKPVRDTPLNNLTDLTGLVLDHPFTQLSGAKNTVFGEIAFGLENKGVPRKLMLERIEEVLHLLHISELRNKHPFTLSGGEMQRVAIASALALKPDILLLDEPTSQLDAARTTEVFRMLANLADQGTTLIIAEYNIEKMALHCHRILLLNTGSAIDFNTPRWVFSRPDLNEHGIVPPLITRLAKSLHIKRDDGLYPVETREFNALGGFVDA
ncbi:energy-coupling factor ABC transporter ATP-binding protein [Thalassobacillus sp. CUG 92003]|uniref:energy-coupling factor ABC transporter ATP-binding protein n=1 Tax=Thalassobacillus sp. CUG 92003 TaxID=2736641 RepID=UPI0015E787A2|nr:ABC transporter ATP-binding protein [Thalassobacillus sp. CUG 92003]